MKCNKKWFVLLLVFFLVFNGAWNLSSADDDDHKKKGWYHNILDWDDDDDDDDHNGNHVRPVDNSAYSDECGGCHFAYPPGLLPSASWIKILDKLDDHFGEEIEIDPDSKKRIINYLKRNSAENSQSRLAVKIMRSLGTRAPFRITDIPHIRKEHHEISRKILARDSIGSLSNCIACHKRADEGIFEDDYVDIPK